MRAAVTISTLLVGLAAATPVSRRAAQDSAVAEDFDCPYDDDGDSFSYSKATASGDETSVDADSDGSGTSESRAFASSDGTDNYPVPEDDDSADVPEDDDSVDVPEDDDSVDVPEDDDSADVPEDDDSADVPEDDDSADVPEDDESADVPEDDESDESAGSADAEAEEPASTPSDEDTMPDDTEGYGGPGSSWEDKMLEAHNKARAQHPDTAPLKWNSKLAEAAQMDVSKCSGHVSVGESVFGDGYGQNWMSNSEEGEDVFPKQCYDNMYERELNVFAEEGLFGKKHVDIMAYKDERQIGHFTQIVWQETEEVGCAESKCPGMGLTDNFVICNYYPPGNVGQQFADNVVPPSSY